MTLTTGEVATVNFEPYTDTYLITVSNATAAPALGPTDGTTVTVIDTLPPGMTATAFYGLGWTTNLATLTATRTDILGPGQSYPPLILKVAVDPTTAPNVTNTATSLGPGAAADTGTGSDPTIVKQIPTHLAFNPQPSNALPGATIAPVEVEVRDAGNNVVADYVGSISLTLSGGTGGAVLTGGGSTAAMSGVATFSGLSVDRVGANYVLNASEPGGLTGTSTTFDINNAAPVLSGLSPSQLAPGQPGFTLTVTGTGFLPGAVLSFNGVAMTTHDGSATQLTADIPASAVATVGSYPVTVLNPAPTAGPSNARTFSVSSPSEVWVDGAWTSNTPGDTVGGHTFGYDAFATVQLAVNGVRDIGTIHVAAGTYTGTINIENRHTISILGVGRDTTIFQPASTLLWNVGNPSFDSRHTSIRVVGSTGIDLSGVTLDQITVRGSLVYGVLYWNATGTLDANRYTHTSPPDLSNYSFVAHVRAVDAPYNASNRAAVAFTNSEFTDTGRVAINVHNWVHLTITGNTFRNNVTQPNTFGYAMEIGSTATGTVSGNTISGYNVPASDNSESAGIYIESAFTTDLRGGPVIPKPVTVTNNEIYACQYGAWVGLGYAGLGGPVAIPRPSRGTGCTTSHRASRASPRAAS